MHKEKPQIVKIALAEKGFKHGVFLMLIFATIDTLLLFMIAYFFGLAIDNGINQDTNAMLLNLAGTLVFIGLSGLRANTHNAIAKKFSNKIFKPIRMIVFGSIIKRQSSSIDDSGETTAQARQNIEKLSNITLTFYNHYICLLFHVLFVVALLVFNLRLSLFYLAILLVTLPLLTLAHKIWRSINYTKTKKHITVLFSALFSALKILLMAAQLAVLIFFSRQLNITFGEIATFVLIACIVTRALWGYPSIVFHIKYATQILKDLEEIITPKQIAQS